MLTHTLVLPTDDDALAASMFDEAVLDVMIVLMVVLGADTKASNAVRIADRLAAKWDFGPGQDLRRVVWVRDAGPALQQSLVSVGWQPGERLFVLNFSDVKRHAYAEGQVLTALALERAFAAGHQ